MSEFIASNGATVKRQGGGVTVEVTRGGLPWTLVLLGASEVEALREYFKARPAPKPWHDAKPWEAWVITIDGREIAVTLDEDREFRDQLTMGPTGWVHIEDVRITAGRRIWPEES